MPEILVGFVPDVTNPSDSSLLLLCLRLVADSLERHSWS